MVGFFLNWLTKLFIPRSVFCFIYNQKHFGSVDQLVLKSKKVIWQNMWMLNSKLTSNENLNNVAFLTKKLFMPNWPKYQCK